MKKTKIAEEVEEIDYTITFVKALKLHIWMKKCSCTRAIWLGLRSPRFL